MIISSTTVLGCVQHCISTVVDIVFVVSAMTALLVIGVLTLAYLLWKTYEFYKTVKAIPSPPGYPLIGNLLYFLSQPGKIFNKTRDFSSKFFPIYRLSSFYFTVVVLLEPNDIELLLSSTKHLSKSRVYNYLSQWLGTGLLTSTGEKWQSRRKILTPAFHFDILQQFITVFNDETEKLVDKLLQEKGQIVNVIPIVTNYTLRSIGETAMGFKNVKEEDYLQYKQAVYRIGNIIVNRLSKPWLHIQALYNWSSLGREEKAVLKVLHGFTNNIILQREKDSRNREEAKKKRMAMLDLLLSAKNEGKNIDHDGIREEVDTFMFEGHDTTSMAISFIILTLANQREAQDKVFEEITEIVGSKKPTFNDLQNLKYTERCIKECLRLFPSVPFMSRRLGEHLRTTTGYLIPRNTIVHVHIFDLHRSPVLYPNPLVFDPDRFLPENMSERHPFAYIPFSAGSRNCIGQRFALLELKTALCGILRQFVLEPVDDMYEIQFCADLVLRPRGGIRVKFVPRFE